MNDIKNLIIYIENEIKTVKKQISDLKNQQVDKELEIIILKIKDVIVDHKRMLQITEDELNYLKKICNENTIYNLDGYRQYLSTGIDNLKESSIQILNEFCNDVLQSYQKYKKENSVDSVEIEELNRKFNKLKSLRYKITDSYEFKANDIDLIVSILKQNNISEEEIVEYIIYIASKFMSNLQKYNFEEKDFVQEKISLEDIVDLFNSYDYDFNVFNNKQKEMILSKGNLNNIRGILEVLKNENINLNDPFNSKTILTARTNQLCEIFVYSTPELVINVIELAKNKIKLYDGKKIDFAFLLDRAGIFIVKKRNFKKEGKEPIDFPKDTVCGCHEDFINNVNLIFEKYKEVYGSGVGFDKFFKKSKLSCVFEASHKKIKNIIDVLEIYGFKTKDYLRALSSFNSTTHADIIDVAIELGCYDYIKDNPSRFASPLNSDIYTKLAVGRMCHLPNEKIFNTRVRSVSGEKYIELNDKYMTEFINQNKDHLTGLINLDDMSFKKFKLEDNYDESYLALFDEIETKIMRSETTRFDLAIKDLELEDSMLAKLENYVDINDPSVYEINGIRVSRNKVLRLYHILKLNNYVITPDFMIYIMTRNSYLTQEHFERLCSGILEIFTQGEMII